MRVSLRIVTLDQQDKLVLSAGNSFRLIELHHIHHLQSDGSYTEIYLSNRKMLVDTRPLSAYEQLLKKNDFYRVNKSAIINLNKVESYNHARKIVQLQNGQQLEVARRRYKGLVNEVYKRTILEHPTSPST